MSFSEEDKKKLADDPQWKKVQEIKQKLKDMGGNMSMTKLTEDEFRLLTAFTVTECLYSIEVLTREFKALHQAIYAGEEGTKDEE